jgi:hypothetical protein
LLYMASSWQRVAANCEWDRKLEELYRQTVGSKRRTQ